MKRRLAAFVVALGCVRTSNAGAALPDQLEPTADGSEARGLFREATTSYDAGDFARAVDLFNRAYELSKLPVILFDIGQTYRSMGQCWRARESFEAYAKAAPDDEPLQARARTRLAELEHCERPPTVPVAPIRRAESTSSEADAPHTPVHLPAANAAQVVLVGQPSAPTRDSGRTSRVACAASSGATLALGLTSAIFAGTAWLASRDVEGRQVWDADSQRADARGRALEGAATGSLIAAGITGILAATTCWVGWHH